MRIGNRGIALGGVGARKNLGWGSAEAQLDTYITIQQYNNITIQQSIHRMYIHAYSCSITNEHSSSWLAWYLQSVYISYEPW